MEFNYRYLGATGVNSNASSTEMSFAPDTLREPTFFRGELRARLPFREAMSALHDVVVSDMRFQPKDRTQYLEFAQQRDLLDLGIAAEEQGVVVERISQLREEIVGLQNESSRIMAPYYAAQSKYFDFLYKTDYDAWFVLDPVITVHPDQVFFECFSQDESSYGRLACKHDVFENVGEFSCGTTNIDYSEKLYNEFQKIRDYKVTKLEIDPSGFDVTTGNDDTYNEVKIDLPDTWVRGFLQVSSAMSLPATSIDLHPMDVHNFLFVLRRKREKFGPRSIRFILEPGKPVRARFDPWNEEVVCPRSIYKGNEAQEIRIWGRRRLHILERLIPVAKKFTLTLLGTGMPSFYTVDLGNMVFTLGLSGWSANDWSSQANFDLLAPREDVDEDTARKVFEALKETWLETSDSLAKRLGMEAGTVSSALAMYVQAGRVIYDLENQVYRIRELSKDPLPMDSLRFNSPREEQAMAFVNRGAVTNLQQAEIDGKVRISAQVQQQNPEVVLDGDQRIVQANCDCWFHRSNQLRQGPCEHILALRLAHKRNAK